MDGGEEERETTYKRAVRIMKVFLSPWICNPRVFEVRIYNPPHHFGSQTLMLRNSGLQIRCDGISNMGFNAPSREEAFRRCDEICSDWRENGFPKNLVESLVKEYAPVTTHRNLDFCPKGETILLNNCVAQIFQGTHTLNAVSVVGGEVIVVQDLSSSPTSYNPITEKFVYRIFPFN